MTVSLGMTAHRRAARVRRISILAAGAIALAVLSTGVADGDYARFLIGAVAFNSITILSISILAGASGIWSLGHTAFIAIGAYMAANLAGAGYPLELIVPAVVVVSALVGYVLGITAGRFSILYFGLLTLAVALTTGELVGRFSQFTGGDQGLNVPPIQFWLLGTALTAKDAHLACVALATLAFLAADLVVKGGPGMRWRAVKSQRIAATGIGLAPHRANANAFAFSAALASVGGVATALTIGFLDPLVFDLRSGIMLIVGTVVGGIGSLLGAVVGALFIVGVPEAGRAVPNFAAFALGAAMIAVLLVLPRGLAPTLLDALPWALQLRRKLAGQPAAAPPGGSIAQLARELMPACEGALSISRLSVSFGGLQVLREVSLEVPPGRTVGLIGPNGAGKTTLINVLSGFVPATECGVLSLGEVDLRRAKPQERIAHGIGRTFQHGELFDDLTVREMLFVAASCRVTRPASGADADAIVDRILDVLRLRDVADANPDELPFGIRKVCDVGRTLAAGASFVALDEPFSGLDRSEIAGLREILGGMKQAGVSILIIDHAVQEVLNIADTIVVLNFGTVLATGTPREISENPQVQEAYFGRKYVARREELLHA